MNRFFCRLLILLTALTACVIFFIQADTAIATAGFEISNVNRTSGDSKINLNEFRIIEREIGIDCNNVVAFAKQYVGAKYVYGASGPKTFDCSGFTMYVMDNFKIKLPHSARRQSLYGVKISREDLRPGDLVFFATFGVRWISHVGMYIGDGEFIHASSTGVEINNLNHTYYKKRYMAAARVIE